MTKLRLPAKVPSEGARRLAWWLCERGPDALPRLAASLRTETSTIERWIAGDLEPGAEMSGALSRHTKHAIVVPDWRSPAAAEWFARPVVRQYRMAA
jgi:hypothetical protein